MGQPRYTEFMTLPLGAKYMKKTTIGFLRYVVAAVMFIIGGLLVLGLLGS